MSKYTKSLIIIWGTIIAIIVFGAIAVNIKEQSDKEAKLASMTPEQRAKFKEQEKRRKEQEEKNKKFKEKQKFYYNFLKDVIKDSAFDPDSVVFKQPVYSSDGVCVSANAKNLFGAYVGFKEYCYIVDINGDWQLKY